MSFLLGKDWNVLALTFERADLYRINGNRTKGRDANKIADNAKRHARTIYWAIFNQKGKLLESGPGPFDTSIPAATLERLLREFPTNETVLHVLTQLQGGSEKAAKIFSWGNEEETQAAPAAAAQAKAAAPAQPTTKTYKLVVALEPGDEFESSLKLTDDRGQLSGTLIAPDGEEVPLDQPVRDGAVLTFNFRFGAGEEAVCLRFEGKVIHNVVKGSLSPVGLGNEPQPGAAPTAKTYKLVVASDEGDEFESSLKLIDDHGQLSGTLIAPDGEEVPLDRAARDGETLSFDFRFGAGDEAVCLHFEGRLINDVVRGSLSPVGEGNEPQSFAAVSEEPTAKTYKLVVASDEGDEFESSLKLIDDHGQLSGTLVAPGGEEVPIDHAVRDGAALSFKFHFGAGQEAVCLHFHGKFLDSVVKGSLS